MDLLEVMEADPQAHLNKCLECLVLPSETFLANGAPETTINEIRMSLSVYLKNVCNNWLRSLTTKIAEHKDDKTKVSEVNQVITNLALSLSQVFVAPNLESKYKYNLSKILMGYFKIVKKLSESQKLSKNQRVFDDLMTSVVELIEHAIT